MALATLRGGGSVAGSHDQTKKVNALVCCGCGLVAPSLRRQRPTPPPSSCSLAYLWLVCIVKFRTSPNRPRHTHAHTLIRLYTTTNTTTVLHTHILRRYAAPARFRFIFYAHGVPSPDRRWCSFFARLLVVRRRRFAEVAPRNRNRRSPSSLLCVRFPSDKTDGIAAAHDSTTGGRRSAKNPTNHHRQHHPLGDLVVLQLTRLDYTSYISFTSPPPSHDSKTTITTAPDYFISSIYQ